MKAYLSKEFSKGRELPSHQNEDFAEEYLEMISWGGGGRFKC